MEGFAGMRRGAIVSKPWSHDPPIVCASIADDCCFQEDPLHSTHKVSHHAAELSRCLCKAYTEAVHCSETSGAPEHAAVPLQVRQSMKTFYTSGAMSTLAESNEVRDVGWVGGMKKGRSTCAVKAFYWGQGVHVM